MKRGARVRGCTGASTLDAIICVSLFSLVLSEAAEAKRTRYLSSFFALCPLLSRAAQRALALPGLRPAFCWKLGKKKAACHVDVTCFAIALSLHVVVVVVVALSLHVALVCVVFFLPVMAECRIVQQLSTLDKLWPILQRREKGFENEVLCKYHGNARGKKGS